MNLCSLALLKLGTAKTYLSPPLQFNKFYCTSFKILISKRVDFAVDVTPADKVAIRMTVVVATEEIAE